MKSFKKHILLFIFILIGMFFIKIENVTAEQIKWEGVIFECIYDDGSLFEYSYNDYRGDYIVNKYSYPLKGADSFSNNTSSTILYSKKSGKPVSQNKCLDYVTKSVVNNEDDGGTTTYIKFSGTPSLIFTDDDFKDSGWKWPWSDTAAETINKGNVTTHKLVSENYILTDEAGIPDFIYRYVQQEESEDQQQAIASPKYITIIGYTNISFAQTQSKTGVFSIYDGQNVMYFNDADPKSYSGSGGTISYYFNAPRIKESTRYINGYDRYVYVGPADNPQNVDSGELCIKIMPQTSKDLAKIIGIVQLVVPVLLILLIGLDIGKLVIAGNLDEELPKQKTKIIVRFVSALVIFFLPLILQILLTTVKVDSGSTEEEISAIQSIKCIIDMVGRV